MSRLPDATEVPAAGAEVPGRGGASADADLVCAARRGDKRAFVEIVARHQAMVCGNGTTWSQQAYLKSSKPITSGPGNGIYDYFGYEIDLSADVVVVSNYGETSDATGVDGEMNNGRKPVSGAAYVFARHGINWNTQAFLKASNTQIGTEFGRAVAVSGNTVVVGSHQERSAATGVNGDQDYECTSNSLINCAPSAGAA